MNDFLDILERRESNGTPIRIGLVGAGKMGKAIIHQTMISKGVRLGAVAEIDIAKASSVLKMTGCGENRLKISENPATISKAIEDGMIALTSNASVLIDIPSIDVVIDATGEVEVGSNLGYSAMMNKKNFVMMNAEADATIGPLLSKMARLADVVYTGDLGDEPGTVMNYLYEPFKSLGFRVVAAGKGKNNPLERHANPRTLKEDSEASGLTPIMLTSFVDGTKTMVEMTILSNATGLLPDVRGMHGPKARVEELSNLFKDRKTGGILESEGIVDYVIGIAPGVFIVVDTSDADVRDNLAYLKVREKPPYTFYRPYHLPGTETLLTAIWAANYHRPVIHARGHFSDTITVAKRELEPGEKLDGIGGYTCYGNIEKRDIARRESLLPIGLSKGAEVKRSIRKDQPIAFEDVEIDEGQLVFRLWSLQEKTIG